MNRNWADLHARDPFHQRQTPAAATHGLRREPTHRTQRPGSAAGGDLVSDPEGLAEIVARTGTRAWRALFDAVEPSTRAALGLVHTPVAGNILLASTGIDHLMLNRVEVTGSENLETAVRIFRHLGVPRYLVSMDARRLPEANAAGRARGLERYRRAWDQLARPPESTSRPEIYLPANMRLRIARPSDAPALGRLFCQAFDVPMPAAPLFAAPIVQPRWHVPVCESRGQIVGAGLVFLDGQSAYLVAGATRPDYRRRGIQRALVMQRVQWALNRGAQVIGSETGVAIPGEANPSWANLVQAGLQSVRVVEHLCPQGTTWP